MPAPNPLLQLSERFSQAALSRERKAATALVRAWGTAWQRLEQDAIRLIEQIDAERSAGREVSRALLLRQARVQELQRQVEAEMARLMPFTDETVRQAQGQAIQAALDESRRLVQAGLPFPGQATARLMAAWNRVPVASLESLVGVLQDGSPLANLLDELGTQTAQDIGEALVNGLVAGRNPRIIAGEMRRQSGLGLTRALRISRTEVLRAHRSAALMAYRMNSRVVRGWRRYAKMDIRTCAACIMAHGRFYRLDEMPDFHVQDRCALIPETVSWSDLGIEGLPETQPVAQEGDGWRWFQDQPADVQREILGGPMYEAWQAGKVQPSQFSHVDHDEVWGNALVASSLKQVLGEDAKDFYVRAGG
jgi:SPP1 gp7 family putative phage head morphogenesis protein